MKKLKKGDEVVVITGKDKGKTGKITTMLNGGERVIVGGINLIKKHVKANPDAGQKGGIIPREASIHASNVMLLCPQTQKGSRVGIKKLEDGNRVRYFKANDELVDIQK